MKKPLAFAAALLWASFWPVTAAAQSEKAVLSNVQGEVSLIRGAETMPAKTGMTCQKGDILKTGSGQDCLVDLAINDKAGCRVLPSSECLLADARNESVRLSIQHGNAVLNLDKLSEGSSFEVETPTAIAAVRGTQFWGRVELQNPDNPVTTFAVKQGTVEVLAKTANQKFTLTEGQALDIPKDTAVVPSIRPALADEMQAMEQASSIRTSA